MVQKETGGEYKVFRDCELAYRAVTANTLISEAQGAREKKRHQKLFNIHEN